MVSRYWASGSAQLVALVATIIVEQGQKEIMSRARLDETEVLAAARTAGALTEADPDYARIKAVVDARAPGEPAEAAGYAAEAPRAATGRPAENAGDLYLALEDVAKAEAMFQLALTKGGIDRDAVLTRLGIAQTQQGKYAEAKATFGQVSGARVPIAQLWTAYVDSKA